MRLHMSKILQRAGFLGTTCLGTTLSRTATRLGSARPPARHGDAARSTKVAGARQRKARPAGTGRRGWSAGAIAALALLAPVRAAAQDAGDFLGSDIPFDLKHSGGYAVTDRPHTELEPLGIHTGSMVLFPAITTGIGYTSNVYGAKTGATGDGFTTVVPQVSLVSQWSRNFLEVDSSAAIKRFFTQPARSETAWSVSADGRWDLGTGDSNIVGLIHRDHGFEAQYSGAFPNNAAGTVGFYQTEGILRGTFVFNRLRLIANEKINDLKYSDTTSLVGGVIDQQYRNRTEYHSGVRLEFAFNPDAAAFTEFSYIQEDYHTATLGQPLRSNHATRMLVGANVDIGKLVRAMIGVGYEKRDYDSIQYPSISGLAIDARVQWLATELTTVNLTASRRVEDAINENSPGYFATRVQMRIDHELLRRVLLFAEGDYEHDSFVALTRRDNQYEARAGATYSLGRHFKLMPSIWYIKRTSQGAPLGQEFSETRGTIELFTQW